MNKAQLKKDIIEFNKFIFDTQFRLYNLSKNYEVQGNINMAHLFASKAEVWGLVGQDYADHFEHVLKEGLTCIKP